MIFSFLHQIVMNFLNFKIILIDGMYIPRRAIKCKVRFDFTPIDSILLQ